MNLENGDPSQTEAPKKDSTEKWVSVIGKTVATMFVVLVAVFFASLIIQLIVLTWRGELIP